MRRCPTPTTFKRDPSPTRSEMGIWRRRMFRTRIDSIAALVASAVLLTACASSDPKQGLADVADLSARIEQVRQASDLAKQRVDAAVKSLQALARFDFKGDATAVYGEFIATVDAS